MTQTCNQEFVMQGCMCLADPMDPYTTVCGYINRQNGLVYPCDPGCCVPKCTGGSAHAPRMGVEMRASTGITLPDGFNVNLPQSDLPTETPGATELLFPPAPPPLKVWSAVLNAFLLFAVIVFALLLIDMA
jgi:hypothetical protein